MHLPCKTTLTRSYLVFFFVLFIFLYDEIIFISFVLVSVNASRGNDGKFVDKNGQNKSVDELKKELAIELTKKEFVEKKPFIDIQLFAIDYSKYSYKELLKAKKSQSKRIENHKTKIEKFIKNADWNVLSDFKKNGRIEWWQKEILDAKNQIERIEQEIGKRRK